jgi:hypothetical protein
MNLFIGLVGATSKGRKGTSWGHVRRLFESVDAEWTSERIKSNLSSGEGLIWAVRDPTPTAPAIKKGNPPSHGTMGDDAGVQDKRLLVFETELASALRSLSREGNTLSAVIRQAWDSGALRIMTKNSPAVATGAHISVVGHITRDELLRYLDRTEVGNGFANRFLWVVVRRSQCLPEGGSVPPDDITRLQGELNDAIRFAGSVEAISRDAPARQQWASVYPGLSEGGLGMFGAVTSRAEAQVMRIACVYALFDGRSVVSTEHLSAALSLWDYASASARYIFGEHTGDPVADDILRALRSGNGSMTRTAIRDLFQKNRRSGEIDRALAALQEAGLIETHRVQTSGRPAEHWCLTSKPSPNTTLTTETTNPLTRSVVSSSTSSPVA